MSMTIDSTCAHVDTEAAETNMINEMYSSTKKCVLTGWQRLQALWTKVKEGVNRMFTWADESFWNFIADYPRVNAFLTGCVYFISAWFAVAFDNTPALIKALLAIGIVCFVALFVLLAVLGTPLAAAVHQSFTISALYTAMLSIAMPIANLIMALIFDGKAILERVIQQLNENAEYAVWAATATIFGATSTEEVK